MGLAKEAMMGIDQERASCIVRLRKLFSPRQSTKDSLLQIISSTEKKILAKIWTATRRS
jgi:hypothetical protein